MKNECFSCKGHIIAKPVPGCHLIRREENIKLSKTKNLTKDEVVLGELRVPDFLVHGVGVVDVGVAAEAGRVQLGFNLFGVSIERRSNRNDHCLTGT